MNLIYRGTQYTTATASIPVSTKLVIGKYRGVPVTFASPAPSSSTSELGLRYRGIAY